MPAKSAKAKLTVVSDEVYQLDRKPETASERIRRLQAEARLLAREQIESLNDAIKTLALQAEDIAKGGDAYPAGIRELSSRLAEELYGKRETLQSLLGRVPLPKI